MTQPIEITIDSASTPYSTTESSTVTRYTYTMNEAETMAGYEGQASLNGNLVWINTAGEVVTGDTAPDGYTAAYVKTAVVSQENSTIINKVEGANGFYKAGVSNVKGSSLPSTGAQGTLLFGIIGSILMIGAAATLIRQKRMS